MVIIAAVDRSERASAVIQEARQLAEAFEQSVHVVHVVTSSEFTDLGLKGVQADEQVNTDRVLELARDVAAEAAADLSVEWEPVGRIGDPADEVVAYASEIDASYIVVAGRKRSPAGKALFGSVAQSILLNADRPTVTAKR